MRQVRAAGSGAACGTVPVCAVNGRMHDLAAGRLAAEDGPVAVAAFERVIHEHGRTFLLGLEEDLGLGAVAVDGNLLKRSVHGREIHGGPLLQVGEDGGTNGFLVGSGFVTGDSCEEQG